MHDCKSWWIWLKQLSHFFHNIFHNFFFKSRNFSLTISVVPITSVGLIQMLVLFTGLITWTRKSTLMFLQQLTLCSSTQTVDETFFSVKYVIVMMSAAELFIDYLSILRDHKLYLGASYQGLRNSTDGNKASICKVLPF